ncbi:secretin receptor [Denticeps clupeoides]|uniref:secretin receptor n=1 Tax=Denticeps clupeoides TaxID=299321 RepID=UPI0010A4C95E|nr:secretin receptor-like [Denticeps clupeoides]
MQGLEILGILFGVYAKIVAFECEPHNFHETEEEDCYHFLLSYNRSATVPDCPGLWDHLNCWPPAKIGQTVSQPCPKFLKTQGKVHRNCTDQGWSEPFPPHEYACELTANLSFHFPGDTSLTHIYFPYVKSMYTAGYAVSLIALVIAICILCLFPKLRCTRNCIHIQLFLSFVLRAAFIFVRDSVLFSSEDLYHCDSYTVSCKCALLVSNYCIMANYSWLLVEGHYLHTLVSVSFFSEKKYLWCYIVLGWGMPLIVVTSWGFSKYFYEDEGCWETRGHDWIWWILRAPVLVFIVVNLFFFLNIIRILVGKLRMSDLHGKEFSQYKRLAKSTFLLVALFGLHYLLFAFLPHQVSGLMYKIFNFIELALASTQGFVVAVLYCFLNGEVQYEIQRKWRRWRLKKGFHGMPGAHHGSLSQSTGPQVTQVSLLMRGPASQLSSLV